MAMAGGLNGMTGVGDAMGGDDRAIALSHAWRMIIVVFTIPLSFRFFAGYIPPAVVFTGGFAQIGALDWSLLIACGVLGTALGRALRLPAPFLTGSMALSALLHITGHTPVRVPPLPLLLAPIATAPTL